jgi:hypothetical protein
LQVVDRRVAGESGREVSGEQTQPGAHDGEERPPPETPDVPKTVQLEVEVARKMLDRVEANGLSDSCHKALREAEKRSATQPVKSSPEHQELCRGDPAKDSTAICIQTCVPNLPREVVALFAR